MCARNECDNTRLRRLSQLRAHSRVRVVLRVDVSLDLGFHVVIGVGRFNVQQEGFIRQLHFTTHTQYQVQKFFSSGCCSPIVSCHRQLNLYPIFLHISHRENGSFEVCIQGLVLDLFQQSLGHGRRQLTDRQAFSLGVIDMYSVFVMKHLLERGVIVIHVLGEPLLGELWVGQGLCEGLDISLHEVVVLGLITCEDVGFVS